MFNTLLHPFMLQVEVGCVGADARRPLPRYEQGAAFIDHKLYVVGGNYGGWLRLDG